MLGLYFSASWCHQCQKFAPDLIEVYNELSRKVEYEITLSQLIKITSLSMSISTKCHGLQSHFLIQKNSKFLQKLFKVWEIPHLVILDQNGKVVSDEAVEEIRAYEVEAYPFTRKRIGLLEKQEEEAKKSQSLRSILASPRSDYVISNGGKRVCFICPTLVEKY